MRAWGTGLPALRAGLVLTMLLTGLTVVWVVRAAPAHACSCVISTPAQQLAGAEAVFLGDVVSREKTGSKWQRLWTIEVSRVFKGDVGPVQEVVAMWDNGSSCGIRLPSQGSVLIVGSTQKNVMAGPIADGQYGTWGCSGSKHADRAPAAFGDGWAPTGEVSGNVAPEPTLVDSQSRWVPVALGGVAVVLLAGAAGVLMWRRRRAG